MKTGRTPEIHRRRMNPRLRRILDHVWGPTGSVILHGLVILLLLQFAIQPKTVRDRAIEAVLEEMNPADLDDFRRELDHVDPTPIDPVVNPVIPAPDTAADPADVVEPAPAMAEAVDVFSPLKMPGLRFGVTASRRKAGLEAAGDRHTDTEACVIRALEWLKDRQLADGSWSGDGAARNPAAMTGLALLCFLAHGETPASSERYGETVGRAIRWLAARQRADGSFDDNAYANAIAVYAVSESYFLTRIPSLRLAMEGGLGRIIAGQQDTGAFTYGYARNGRRDTSVAGWQVQALKAGLLAGADVPGLEAALRRCADGLCANHERSTGRFLYAPEPGKSDGSRPTLACTGIGVLSLQMLGRASSREVEGGLRALEDHRPDYRTPEGTGRPLYAWYYITQAMFREGKTAWRRWNGAFARTMTAAQNADGSWVSAGEEEVELGPVYGTTFSALSLMVYYRALGTYAPVSAPPQPGGVAQPDDVPVVVL